MTIIDNHLRRPVRKDLRIPGIIPYYGANNIQDWVRDYSHDGEYVLVTRCGSNDLKNYSIQYATGQFCANDHVHVVKGVPNKLLTKFLYYYLKTFNFVPFLNGNDRVILNRSQLIQIPLPILPLPIQEKIVAYLDRFEQYLNPINGLLHQEIQLREQQYLYYRDWLLNFKQ